MAKKKHNYKFNPHTLTFEKVKVSIKDRLKMVSFSVALGVVLAVIFTFLGYSLIDSPKEKRLKRENAQYKRQLAEINRRMNLISDELADLENRDDNIYRTIFEAEPISPEVRNSGIGGVERYNELQG